jgi:hypothetical protein
LNVVQENVIKGGITSRDRNYKRHTTKEIKGIDQNVKLNKLLWSFADELRKLHGGIAV